MNVLYSKTIQKDGFVRIDSVKELITTLSEKKVKKLILHSDNDLYQVLFFIHTEMLHGKFHDLEVIKL